MNCKLIRHTSVVARLAIFASFMLFLTANAEAKQYKKVVNGRELVVHTNPIPVLLHRMVPPQYGRHVTEKEVVSNSIPPTGRVVSQRNR